MERLCTYTTVRRPCSPMPYKLRAWLTSKILSATAMQMRCGSPLDLPSYCSSCCTVMSWRFSGANFAKLFFAADASALLVVCWASFWRTFVWRHRRLRRGARKSVYNKARMTRMSRMSSGLTGMASKSTMTRYVCNFSRSVWEFFWLIIMILISGCIYNIARYVRLYFEPTLVQRSRTERKITGYVPRYTYVILILAVFTSPFISLQKSSYVLSTYLCYRSNTNKNKIHTFWIL